MTRFALPAFLVLASACELEDPKDTDTGTAVTDADGDGFAEAEDCDDADAAINPDAAEVCDGVDNDCDELVDDADDSVDLTTGSAFYVDADGDGYGVGEAVSACAAPSGYAEATGDCDDANAATSPDAAEVCDGVDNDCDALIDDEDDSTDLSTGTVAYADVDMDGFGDPKTAQAVCVLPKGATDVGEDCNDANAGVYPGAAELCDGTDNDCDAKTTEVGVASWEASDGSWSDWTGDLTPSGAAPVDVDLDEAGTLYLCEGTWSLNIDVSSDVSIVAPAGPEVTTIDAGGAGQGIAVTGGSVFVTGTAITDGLGEGTYFGSFTVGGGIYCEGGASLVVQDADIHTNTAGMGGGVFTSGCDVTISDSTIRDNAADYAGGGAAFFDSTALVEYSTVSGNELPGKSSDTYGGGLLVFTYKSSVTATLDIDETIVEDNTGYYGSGLFVPSADATCTGTKGSNNGGFYGHSGGLGAVYVEYNATFSATNCDFGAARTADDNSPADVSLFEDTSYSYDDDASFSCSTSGCK